ncbi:MAG TPA: sigma factor-like helix-turn-helix DNA-binding protein, partial [Urbifossiella sp.]|nr:sigma factor-like helix-turn-helix DNA-binding protein [Urbifossiella sp.]
TFLVLVRHARSVRDRRCLGSWLHGVALRLARRAGVAAARAGRDARPVPAPPPGPTAEAGRREVESVLDDELGRLPECYRLPLILCYLEGRTRDEAAARMGCTPGRLKGLLERGRERLRARLVRRGLAPAAAWAVASAGVAATPVPPSLAAAARVAAGPGECGASPAVHALVAGGVPMAGLRSVPLVLVSALVAVAIGLGAVEQPGRGPARVGEGRPKTEAAGVEKQKADPAADEAAVAAHIKALASPDSDTRAAAAAGLRRLVAKYPSGTVYLSRPDGGEAAWRAKLRLVREGMDREAVLKILPPSDGSRADGGIHDGGSYITTWQLDEHWTAMATFYESGELARRPELLKGARRVYVAPPPGFTGAWVTWHVNGQKGYEIQFKDGKYDGTFTTYHDTGAKHVEQHYTALTAHGADTGWFPDGRLNYTARYRDGKQDGTWTHWYANGVRQSETRYNNGRYHGRNTRWHENGRVAAIDDYRDGVRHGVEVSWDENGVPHYKRTYANGRLVD